MKITVESLLAAGVYAAISQNEADTLASIRDAAVALTQTKDKSAEATAKAKEAGATLWPLVRSIGKASEQHEQAAGMEAGTVAAIATAAILDALNGEPAAVKTVKAYTSTARRCIVAVRNGTVRGWPVLESKLVELDEQDEDGNSVVEEQDVSYEEARNALRTDDQRRVKAAHKALAKMIGEIAGRDNGRRSAATRLNDLAEATAAVQSLRDRIVSADEAAKPASKAAAAADSVRQQQPSAPMQTEVSRAA